MPTISVVMPVFNLEQYLYNSIQSVLTQDFKDVEIICVDDGSSDNSANIIQDFAKSDSRVKYYYKENSGVSETRNYGMRMARGKIITFLDGDDCFAPYSLRKIAEAFDENNIEVLTFSGTCVPAIFRDYWIEDNINCKDEFINSFSFDLIDSKGACPFIRVAFLRSFIEKHSISFIELPLGEDTLFLMDLYLNSKKIQLMSDQLYLYNLSRQNSAVSESKTQVTKKLDSHLKLYEKMLEKLEIHDELYRNKKQIFSYGLVLLALDIFRLKQNNFEKYFSSYEVLINRFFNTQYDFNNKFLNDFLEVLLSKRHISRFEKFAISYKIYAYLYGADTYYKDLIYRKILAHL